MYDNVKVTNINASEIIKYTYYHALKVNDEYIETV